jgi:catechol 2,3-dioxygenase-like lactoylglutathione lyase family enzyme
MTRLAVSTSLLCAALAWTQPVELKGIAHVAFRIGDLAKSRDFYQRLGFKQAFAFEDAGKTAVAFMKINDHQFIELYPRTAETQPLGLMHVCFETDAIEALRSLYVQRELAPTPINKARAGNLLFSIYDPEGRQLEYLQYLPGSLHVRDRGLHLGEHRISQRLSRAVETVRDLATERSFYGGKLGIGGEIELDTGTGESKPRTVFQVAAVADAAKELRRRGFSVQATPTAVSIVDPDGAVIVFTKADSSRQLP